jgi:FAD/FMN-containing dehydrogenase
MIVTEPSAVSAVSRLWNAQVEGNPSVVVRCRATADVQAAVNAARSAGLPLSVLAGGHDWAGSDVRDGGLLVDLSTMRQVTVDGDGARVGGGATVSDVFEAVRSNDRAAAVGTVGYAGLVLGGGYGPLIGVAGLGVDNLLSVEVVLANGQVVTADPENHPDLFWALRGGGGNFGVVTEILTRLHPFAAVTSGMIAFGWDQARSVLRGGRDLTASGDDALDVTFGALNTPADPVLFTIPTWPGDPDQAAAQIARVRELGEPVLDDVDERALADTVRALNGTFPRGNYRLGARILPGLTDGAIDDLLRSAEAMPATCALHVHLAHGAATRVLATETAYPYRDEHGDHRIVGRR